MNNLKFLKKFITLVMILVTECLFADQGTVLISNSQVYDTNITAYSITTDGTNTYVANGTNGIVVLENNMSLKYNYSIDANITSLKVDEGYIYAISTDKQLYVFEILDDNLSQQDTLALSGDINNILVKNDYVYVANGDNGIKIVDTRVKTDIKLDGTLSTTDAKDLEIKGDTLFLADGWGGFKTINIAVLNDPDIISTVDGNIIELAIDGNSLFTLDSDGVSLNGYDITNAINPILKTTTAYDLVNNTSNMFAYDSNLYAKQNSQISIYSTIDLTTIVTNGNYNKNINDIMLYSSYAYLATSTSIEKVLFDSDFPDDIDQSNVNDNTITLSDDIPEVIKKGILPLKEDDIDIIKVNPNVGALTIDLVSTPYDVNCTLYDSSSTLVKSVISNAGVIKDFINNVDGGTYYIEIKPLVPNDAASIDYTLTMGFASDAESNIIETASLITFDEFISGNIITSADKDMFKVYASGRGTITVDSEQTIKVSLYDNQNNQEIISTTPTDISKAPPESFKVDHAGYYFVEISSTVTGLDYVFTTTFAPNQDKIDYEDVSLPSLKLLETPNMSNIGAMTFDASYVYFGTSTAITKRERDATLTTIDTFTTNKQVNDMIVVGNFLYAVFNDGYLGKYSIKDNTITQIDIKQIAQNQNLNNIIVDGNFAYVASSTNLYKVDISTSTIKDPEFSYASSDTINDIALRYNQWNKQGITTKTRNCYVYLATTDGIKVYSADEEALLETYNKTTLNISKIQLDNNRLYATLNNDLVIYDISVPVYASELSRYTLATTPADIALESNKIYLAPSLQVVDISDEKNVKFLKANNNSEESSLIVRDGISYCINSDLALSRYEINNDYEDDNTTEISVAIDGTITGNISSIISNYTSNGEQDNDYIRVDLKDSGTLKIDFTSSSNDINYTTTFLNFQQDMNNSVVAGRYYIIVSGANTDDYGNYSFNLNFTADDYSDYYKDATLLSSTTTEISGNLFDSGEDQDWFKIELKDRSTIDLSTITDGNTTTKIELYYDDGIHQITKDGYNTQSDDINGLYNYKVNTTLNPGTYYIKVTNRGDDIINGKGDYKLNINIVATDDFILNNGVDNILDFNINKLAYGYKNIYTITNDSNLISYSHLLREIGRKPFYYDLDNICDKPFIVNAFMYVNMQDNNTTGCNHYKKISIDTVTQDDSSDFIEDEEKRAGSYLYNKDYYLVNKGSTDVSNIQSIALKDNILYVAQDDKILSYNIEDKTNPIKIADYGKHRQNTFVQDGNFTYVVDDYDSIYIYDGDTFISNYFINYSVDKILVSDNNLFVHHGSIVDILDISNKQEPKSKKTIEDVKEMKLYIGELCLVKSIGFEIYNSSLELIKKDTTREYMGLDKEANLLYLTTTNGIYKFDEYNNYQVIKSQFIVNSTKLELYSIYMYLQSGNYLKVYNGDDLFNISSPASLSSLDTGVAIEYTLLEEDNTTTQLPVELKGTISDENDVDDYYFNVDKSGRLTFEGISDLNISIERKSGDSYYLVNENSWFYSGYDYRVRVVQNSNINTNDYDIKIIREDQYEYRDSKKILPIDKQITTTTSNSDYYEINLERDTVAVFMYNSSVSLNVVDENITQQNVVDTIYDPDNRKYQTQFSLAPGRYFVKISGNSTYTLEYKKSPYFRQQYFSTLSGANNFEINDSNLTIHNNEYKYTYFIGDSLLPSLTSTYEETKGDIELDLSTIEVSDGDLYSKNDNGDVTKYDISSRNLKVLDENVSKTILGNTVYSTTHTIYDIKMDNNYLKRYYTDDNNVTEEVESLYIGAYNSDFIVDEQRKYGYFYKSDAFDIVSFDSLYYQEQSKNVDNVQILNADNRYKYEYTSPYIFRSDVQNVNTDSVASEMYAMPNLDFLVPKGDVALLGYNNTLTFVYFQNGKVAELKEKLIFDTNIEFIKVHPTLNVVYVKLKDQHGLEAYNFDDPSNLKSVDVTLFNSGIMPSINSIHIVDDKLFVASKEFGLQGAKIEEDGKLAFCKSFENVGTNVQKVFSMDGSTINFITSDDNNSKQNLNVYFLRKENIIDGNSDSLYTVTEKEEVKEGCFIATAAYGSYFENHVKILREFRDKVLLTNELGKRFVKLYYTYSPAIATNIAQNEYAKMGIRVVLTPVVYLIKYPLYSLILLLLGIALLINMQLKRKNLIVRG